MTLLSRTCQNLLGRVGERYRYREAEEGSVRGRERKREGQSWKNGSLRDQDPCGGRIGRQ
jgi:hypothetical protein